MKPLISSSIVGSKKLILPFNQINSIFGCSEVLVPLLFRDPRSIDILGKMPQSSYICKKALIERYHLVYQERLEGKIGSAELIERLLQVEIKAGELNPKFLS